ncbi:MAG: ATP-binding cassette domain-containing protein [Planctomycetota bacterium]
MPRNHGEGLLSVRRVSFDYGRAGRDVLHDVDLELSRGDRVVLEGPSGSGKSTLAALALGLRRPSGGTILASGLDRASLGARRWRTRVSAAPQEHENHVFTGSFVFNVLLGRAWPPSPDDLAEAETLCRELGLGDLVDTMPDGMWQQVGETGWRLSHGERARLFVARALLQGADTVVLDESLGALDTESRRRVLACAGARAGALVVVAHP